MAPKGRETTVEEREIIVRLHQEGSSFREIGRIVERSFSTIQKIVKKYNDTKSCENKPRSGRPRKLTEATKRHIVRKIKANPDISAPKLAAELENSFNVKVCGETIRNVLRKENLHGRTARKKPWISEVNRKRRLAFAKQHRKSPAEFWRRVIFSDESKFNIFASDGRRTVWRKPGQAIKLRYLTPTVKHGGGSVLVWGCFSSSGVGNLVFIDGIMDRWKYLRILKENLTPSAEHLGLSGNYLFQQDNDPKHTAWDVRMWLLFNTPKMLKTPPQSPDLNPIEHLWTYLKKQLRQHKITNKETLKRALKHEWQKIDDKFCKKLIDSMPKRIDAVIQSRGGPTKY